MPLTTLFIDLNSYFASVEQQLQPHLRAKPIVVVPGAGESETACCIAASYEAKRHAVKTGMRVFEARRHCPEVTLVPARPRLYVEFHHEIIKAVDSCLPVHAVHSIDEMSCRLAPNEREPAAAIELAQRVKRAIADRVGECLRCSAGIAPNRFLAKVGTDMQKPDGLVVIEERDLPQKLFSLSLTDLPGIGKKMEQRLSRHNIRTVEQLCALSESDMARAWESVVGRRWWHWLRGHDSYDLVTRRRSIGHQHVLAPKYRNEQDARAIAFRLLHKAAARARSQGYLAREATLWIRFLAKGKVGWGARAAFPGGTDDSLVMGAALARLWHRRAPGVPLMVSVTLQDLVPRRDAPAPLFPGEQQRSRLFSAIDRLNTKHGRNTVHIGAVHHVKDAARGGIAFTSVPDLEFGELVG